mgnify:FL=1|jgi:glucan phosphoethanolaminetransferase (alkaline phosphatase superfamily)|tara:strand:- start:1053 stop:1427 length:375 start_codon:yes stop_codon:yes gene_type:complete
MIIKKFAQGFILGVVTTGAITIGAEIFAQELSDDSEESVLRSKPVECYASQSVLTIAEDQGYEVFWQGANIKDNYPDNTIAIIINAEQNSWMALEMNIEAACVLGFGGNFWLFDQYYYNDGDAS